MHPTVVVLLQALGSQAQATPVGNGSTASFDCGTPAVLADEEPVLQRKPLPEDTGEDGSADNPWLPCGGPLQDDTSSLSGERVFVEFPEAVAEEDAQSVLDAFESAWTVAVDELGWPAPPLSDLYPLHVYVTPNGGSRAVTREGKCGMDDIAFIEISDEFIEMGTLEWVSAHEFTHASQFASSVNHDTWWYEASAQWLAYQVTPLHESWHQFHSYYADYPWISLTASGPGPDELTYLRQHTYAMVVFAFFLDQHLGGPDTVRNTWRMGIAGQMKEHSMATMLSVMGYQFDQAYLDYLATMAAVDLEVLGVDDRASLTQEVEELPASGTAPPEGRPMSMGHNILRFDRHSGGEGLNLVVSVEGSQEPTEWYAALVTGEGRIEEVVVIDMSSKQSGRAAIPFHGDRDVYLVVSPVVESAWSQAVDWSQADTFGYTWSARVSSLELVGVDGPEQGPELGDTAPSAKSGGCSFSPTGRLAGGTLLFLAFLGFAHRRRGRRA